MRFLLIVAVLLSNVSPAQPETFFNPRTAHAMVEKREAVLVDVREEEEIASGMAQGAYWLPTSKIKANAPELHEFIDGLSSEKTVIVYCGSGRRAAYFVEWLLERDYKAENMGGFGEWIEAGLPTMYPPEP